MPPISRPASSAYWTPPTHRQRRLSEIPQRRPGDGDVSSNISTSTSRNYVDPWDLENYAFMKRHCTDNETEYVVTSSQSDFYYVPQYNHGDSDEEAGRHFPRYVHEPQDDSIGLVNEVDEQDFYNERYEMYSPGNSYLDVVPRSKLKPNGCLYPRTDAGDSYEDYDPCADYSDDSTAQASSGIYSPRVECQLYSPSVMLRRAPSHQSDQSLVYVYETGSRKRKMAFPKGNLRRNSTNSHNYRSRRMMHDMYPEVEPPYMMASYDDLHHPYYDIYCSKPFPTPQHFGLSKYGHLKIDYSFSWNSLDRYIAMD